MTFEAKYQMFTTKVYTNSWNKIVVFRSTQSLLLLFLLLLLLLCHQPAQAVKCYVCEYNINYCKDPNCYNNYDICSANQFAMVLVPVQECPQNCMLKAVTNPAGIVLKWKRLCAPRDDLTKGFNCRIDYVFGARIEQCTCDKDFCNGSPPQQRSISMYSWIVFQIIVMSMVIRFYSST